MGSQYSARHTQTLAYACTRTSRFASLAVLDNLAGNNITPDTEGIMQVAAGDGFIKAVDDDGFINYAADDHGRCFSFWDSFRGNGIQATNRRGVTTRMCPNRPATLVGEQYGWA